MKFISVSISGFGPFASEKKVDFEDNINIIRGSNGSGKTNVIDAITWCLFGPASMSGKLNGHKYEVINSLSSRASVELVAENSNKEIITIHRSLSATSHRISVYKNGKLLSKKITESQKIINDNLSLVSRDSYNSVSSISSSPILPVSPFISGSASDRRKIISDLVDPGQKNLKRNKKVALDIKNLKKSIALQEGKVEIIRNSIEDKKAKIPDISNLGISEVKAKINDISVKMEEIRKNIGSSFDVVGEAKAKLDKINNDRDNFISKKKNVSNEISQLESNLEALEKELNELHSARHESIKNKNIPSSFEKLNELIMLSCNLDKDSMFKKMEEARDDYVYSKANLEFIDVASHEDHCPVCDSDTSSDKYHDIFEDKINDLKNKMFDSKIIYDEMNKKNKGISSYESLVSREMTNKRSKYSRIRNDKEIEKDIANVEQKISDTSLNIRKHKGWLNQYEYVISQSIPERIKEQEDIIKNYSENQGDSEKVSHGEFNRLSEQKSKLSEKLIALSNKETLADSMMNEINNQQSVYDKESEKLEELESQMDNLLAEKERTGVSGDISEMIKNACDEISEKSNDSFHRLFPDYKNWTISIVSEESDDQEDDEDFDEDDVEKTLKISVNGSDLSVYSHGEQMRMIISISIALCEFYQEKMGEWPTPLWDEPSIAIDGDFIDIIKSINGNYQDENRQFIICSRIDESTVKTIQSKTINVVSM